MAFPRTERTSGGSIHLATVTRVTDGHPYAESVKLAAGFEYGPLISAAGTLLAGDKVLLGFMEDQPDDPVILGRIGGPRP